jgi:hypothetical protein
MSDPSWTPAMEPQRAVAFMAGQRRIPTRQMGFIARIGQGPREASSPRSQASGPAYASGTSFPCKGQLQQMKRGPAP